MIITIGVCGSVAAIKVPGILSQIKEQRSYMVNIIATTKSRNFVGPGALGPYAYGLYYDDDKDLKYGTHHITIAKTTGIFILLPATANTIAKVANGICDTFLTQTILALPKNAKKIFCPAMNTEMLWSKPTVNNFMTLKENGWTYVSPVVGRLACGGTGDGVLAKTETIINTIIKEAEGI